jgi:hypothetical protein
MFSGKITAKNRINLNVAAIVCLTMRSKNHAIFFIDNFISILRYLNKVES